MDNQTPSFGDLLRRARQAAGLSQTALAVRAGLSARGVSDLERGARRRPHPDTLDRLADALGLAPPARAAWAATAHGGAASDSPWPRPLTAFVGRATEVEAIAALVQRRGIRLVTLTGPGGVGKTRLALRVAEEVAGSFHDGVWFVALAPIRDSALVAPTVAEALGVRASGNRAVEASIHEFLKGRHGLLVLDNFEHVLDAGPLLAGWLASCPELTIIVTSRATLRLSGEHVVDVHPLSLASSGGAAGAATLLDSEAVQLFVNRATATRRDIVTGPEDLAVIATICEQLDGLPLAIELAAARLRSLPLGTLLALLERRLELLTEGPRDQPARLRSMRDAIAWSYDLLAPEEKRLFRRLAVFVGGFDLAGAAAISERDSAVLAHVHALVDASLIRPVPSTGAETATPRFTMLETVREFGLEQLALCGDEREARRLHADHFDAVVAVVTPTPRWPATAARIRLIDTEKGNLRATLTWLDQVGDYERYLRLATRLFPLWTPLGNMSEGRRWLERGVERGTAVPADLRGLALGHAGTLASLQGECELALSRLEEALALAGTVAHPTLDNRMDGAMMHRQMGHALVRLGRYREAEPYMEVSLRGFRELGNDVNVALSHEALGSVAYAQGDLSRAKFHSEAAISLLRSTGSPHLATSTLQLQGLIACHCDDTAGAVVALNEALALGPAAGEPSTPPDRMATVAVLAMRCGMAAAATRLFGAAAARATSLGEAFTPPESLTFEYAMAEARASIGEDSYVRAWAEGQALTYEKAEEELWAILAAIESSLASNVSANGFDDHVLTKREQEVLRLVANGLTNREIANTLYISIPTVKRHLSTVYGKLGVASRADASDYARSHGFV